MGRLKSKYIIGIDEVGRAASKRRASPHKYIIGIDEVGRGALAGPVTVTAVLMPQNFKAKIRVNPLLKIKNPRISASIIKLRDSKKLSSKQREIWFQWIKKHSNILKNVGMFYTTANVSPKIIDKINISNAANLAATRAFTRLVNNFTIVRLLTKSRIKVFLDGGLYLNKNLIRINQFNPHKSASTVIKGDEKIPAIALASIVAKVSRDREMRKLHKKYPQYDFIHNVGYGTKKHISAIKKFGFSPLHRRSFKIGRI